MLIYSLAVMGWQNTCESAEDIKATLAALNTEIDISVLYRGLDPKSTHNLVSVVCILRYASIMFQLQFFLFHSFLRL